MSRLFSDPNAAWAALIIVVLPLFIIGTREVEERLRQRDSEFQGAFSIVRVWIVPLSTVWILVRTLFDVGGETIGVRVLGSALVLAAATSALSALRVIVARLINRPRHGDRRPIPRLLLAMPRLVVILAAAWFLIAGVWGVDLSSALTALGVTSLVISFALQDTLGGIASGFTLLADSPFSPGDWIESDGVEGRVIDVNWRSTRVENRDGDLVVIPNGQLANATIVNYDQPSRLHRVKVPVQIERTAPPTAAIAMLVDAARSTAGVVADPPPFARVTQIADPVVDYEASMWIEDFALAPRVKADFGALVWYLSYRHGVPLPNPAQDLYLFDGAKTALESRITAADLRRYLVESRLLSELEDDVLDRLAAGSRLAQYQRDEVITTEGDQHDLLLLHRGRAALVLRGADRSSAPDVDVLDIDAGELFGLLDEQHHAGRVAMVLASTDCDVVRIASDAAAFAISRSPELALVLDQLGATRRRRIERVIRRSIQPGAATPQQEGRPS
jgi:small-conductance mechanosensitive channel/CRP-like cAMP-binding protein